MKEFEECSDFLKKKEARLKKIKKAKNCKENLNNSNSVLKKDKQSSSKPVLSKVISKRLQKKLGKNRLIGKG